MLAQVHSFVLQGIEPTGCEVEVDLPDIALEDGFRSTVVGLPDAAVKESIERVRTAMFNSGYPLPPSRAVISLAPGDLKKEGPLYDLPIAVGLLLSSGAIKTDRHRKLLFAGELALDGRLRPVAGVINLALLARKQNFDGVVVPIENGPEASAVQGIEVYAVDTLAAVVAMLRGDLEIDPLPPADITGLLGCTSAEIDFADVRGQEAVKRALVIAAAGAHNILMIGPPGSGKSMMAKALPGILPPLSPEEALEVTRIYSSVGLAPRDKPLITQRPVRSPHHTASTVAVIGGGMHPRPGEVSLSHHGVLFLDELPEFPRAVLETLRQPLEDHRVSIARANGRLTFPARFMLVAALNPTPKGQRPDDPTSQRAMDRYLAKLSGPLIDRIDLHVDVPAVPHQQLMSSQRGTDSAHFRDQVIAARAIQAKRNGGPLRPNATLTGRELDDLAPLPPAGQQLLSRAIQELGLSARAYDKLRRIARTLADLDHTDPIALHHLSEAISYRLLDRRV